jgi:hypothetical protein
MGFDVSYIVDILKFPWPLFPKYKYNYPVGLRFDIPALHRDFVYEINLPAANKYELQSITFSATGYKDGDFYSLKKNNEFVLYRIFTKELGQVKDLRPVVRVDADTDTLTFIFSNETGTSKVIWVDLDFTAQKPVTIGDVETPELGGNVDISPLAYFYAVDGQPGYIDPSYINTVYWAKNLVVNSIDIPTEFWEGRDTLLAAYGNLDTMIEVVDSYHKYLFKFVKDTIAGFTSPFITSKPWVEFKDDCALPWKQGGFGLSSLNRRKRAEIYLSHMLRVPVKVFSSADMILEGNRIDFIKQYLKPEHMFVFDWVDFADVEDDPNIGGFAFDPAGVTTDPDEYRSLRTIKSYINIEPQTLYLDADYSRVAHPREYYFPEGSTSWLDAHYHYMDGETDPLEAYDLNTNDPVINTAEVFTHEMGHAIDFYQRDKTGKMFSQQADWLGIGGWEADYFDLYEYGDSPFLNVTQYKSIGNGVTEPPVSPYGASHPVEDFAETYALYCCNPRVLKEQFPRMWMFMEQYVKNMVP